MSVSEAAYQTLFDENPDGLLLIESETGRIRECNRRFCELADRDRERIRGETVTSVATASQRSSDGILAHVRREDPEGETHKWTVTPDSGASPLVEARLSSVTVDGEPHVLARVSPIRTPGERLRDRDRLVQAVDAAPIGVTVSDPSREDNPLIYANDGFQKLTGYAEEEVLGRNCRFLQGDATASEPVEEIREAVDAEKSVTVELRNYRRDGTEFWNRVTIAPVRVGETVEHFVGFQQDITDRKQSEQELEAAQRLLEAVPSGVLRTEATSDGTFEYVNPALVSLLNAESAEELRDHRVAEVYADPEERDTLIEALRSSDQERVRHEVEFQTLDGETKDVAVTAALTEDATRTEHLHKVVQDITDRKEREAELRRYERLVENLPIGVYQNTAGPDGEFRFLNEAMADIFDADSVDALRDQTVKELYADPEQREAFSETLREEGAVTERELELVTLDGEEIWGSVTAIAHEDDGEVLYDGVIQDITARKRYEQQLAEQRDNLDLMNQMLRHDIRNDLQLVTAYADVLDTYVDEAGQGYLETIRESAAHAVELTETARDLADVMRSTDDTLKPVELRSTLHAEVEEVRSEYQSAAVTVKGAIPRCSVLADELLDSVFRNLLTNAIQHNDSEVPEVTVTASEGDGVVEVRIADNGPGVPDAQKDAVFGKGEKGLDSGGTGIGLYLVEQLVDAYGGTVRVEDNDPEGAVFVVELSKAD
ncbi:MAG: PAS domain S-box protein [Halobacteriaceae archaeon]